MTRMVKKGDCSTCGEHRAFGNIGLALCRPCNRKRRLREDPDYAYRAWLTRVGGRDFIPNETAMNLIEMAMEKYDTYGDMCAASNVADRRIYDVRNKGRGMEYASAAKVAMEAGMLAEFEAMTMRQFGRDEWSDLGRFCGDGSPGALLGCGTFHHESHALGLCEECYGREVVGSGPTEPRDVRLAVKA